ncbi:hypothetical protein BDF22DRAFT_741549 [Syncephalis plumigaleata]|nr:hypothetical protein BDF22DRAFT_741549 [Syncephalis plumigaleata]
MNYSQASPRGEQASMSNLRTNTQPYFSSTSYQNSTSNHTTANNPPGMFAFIRRMTQLVLYHFVPTFIAAVRVRLVNMINQTVRLIGRGVHFFVAASLAGWLLLSAWWIAAAVGTGAWAAALVAAAIAWSYRLWCSLWPWSSKDTTNNNNNNNNSTMSRSFFWWLGYALWPFAWLQAWRQQRLRQRPYRNTQSRQTSSSHHHRRHHQHQTTKVSSSKRRPLTSDSVTSSPSPSSQSSSDSSSSGVPTPNGMTLSPMLPRRHRRYTSNCTYSSEDAHVHGHCDDITQHGVHHVHLSA